jgi:hypothetical protein
LFLAIRVLASERGLLPLADACHKRLAYVDDVGDDKGWRFQASESIKKPIEIAFKRDWAGDKPSSPGKGAHH